MNQALVKKQQMEYFSIFILLISCILFRIQVGDIGIGYMLTALTLYEALWVIFGARFSDVTGRILRSKYSKGKLKLARAVWKKGLTIQFFTGIIASVILMVSGTVILSKGFGFVHSYYLVWFLAPTLFLRMLSEAYLGFLYGRNNEAVAGLTSIIRQIIILVMGSILSMAVKEYGNKVAALLKQEDFASIYGNIGILISAFVAEIVVLVLLMISRLNIKRGINDYEDEYYHRTENTGNVLLIAWKRRTGENLNLILFIVPLFIVIILLNKVYGSEIAYADNIGLAASAVIAPCGLIVVIGYVFLIPILGRFSMFVKKHEMRYARNSFQAGIHFCFILGFGAAAFFCTLGKYLAAIISQENSEKIKVMYFYGALCIVFGLVAIYLLKTLWVLGYGLFVAIVQAVSAISFGFILYGFFISKLDKLYALMIAILIYFVMISLFLFIFVLAKLDMVINPITDAVIPLFSAGLSSLAVLLLSKLMAPHLGNIFTCVVCLIVILMLYFVLLLFFRNFKENELEFMPGKKFIISVGQMMHVL